MNPIERLKYYQDNMTKTELLAAEYLINHPDAVLNSSLTLIARNSKSSNTAIIRLCKKIGYDGFAEFKFSMSRYLLSHIPDTQTVDQNPMLSIISTYTRYINQIVTFIDEEEIKKMAYSICNAEHISIWGINRTSLAAIQLSHRLTRIGIFNQFTSDWIVMNDHSNILKQGDVCILFSVAGRGSKEYANNFKLLKERGCTNYLVTMDPTMKVSNYADITIRLPWISHEETCHFYEDQIINFIFNELLLFEVAKIYPDLTKGSS